MESKNDKKTNKNNIDDEVKKNQESSKNEKKNEKKELSIEDKLKETENKLLRTLAELENQRRRFEKETKEAFEFGGFNFAKETLTLLDNLQRAKVSIKNDEVLKNSKDQRSYRQSSKKLLSTGFKNKYCVEDAILEIKENYENKKFIASDKCYTVKWMKTLNLNY